MGENLEKRIYKGEIHLSLVDKGKGAVIIPLRMNSEMVYRHTEQNQEVNWKDLELPQKEVRSHAGALSRVFGLGGDIGWSL